MNAQGTSFSPPVKADNCSLLSNLIEKYGITIPNKQFDGWRPVSRAGGYIQEWSGMVFILCTDGNIGWFVTQTGQTFQAHIANFSGPVDFWSIDYVDGWDHENRRPKLTEREQRQQEETQSKVDELLAWLEL